MELVSLSNVLTALSQTCAQCSMRAPQYNWRRAPLEHHSLRRHGNIRYAWFYFNLRCCSLFCMSDLYYRPVAARQLFSACFRHQLPGPYRAPLCAFRRRHSGYQPHCCVLFFFLISGSCTWDTLDMYTCTSTSTFHLCLLLLFDVLQPRQ